MRFLFRCDVSLLAFVCFLDLLGRWCTSAVVMLASVRTADYFHQDEGRDLRKLELELGIWLMSHAWHWLLIVVQVVITHSIV